MQEDQEKHEEGEAREYPGGSSGGYGSGGADADFEEVTGQKDAKLEDVFPENADERKKADRS